MWDHWFTKDLRAWIVLVHRRRNPAEAQRLVDGSTGGEFVIHGDVWATQSDLCGRSRFLAKTPIAVLASHVQTIPSPTGESVRA
jgi:hypothetical protein